MSAEGQHAGRPPGWQRNLILYVGVVLIFVASLCFGLYFLMIELKLSHTKSVLIAVSVFAIYFLLLAGIGVSAIRNPPKDPYAGLQLSPEQYRSLSAAARSMVGWPLGVPIGLIAKGIKRLKEAGKKGSDESTKGQRPH